MSSIEGTPDPVRLLDHWREAAVGDITAGRVVANLKQAGMPAFLSATLTGLQEAGADSTAVAAIVDAWSEWERGKLPPQPLVDILRANDLEGLLEGSVAAHAEVFGHVAGTADDATGRGSESTGSESTGEPGDGATGPS